MYTPDTDNKSQIKMNRFTRPYGGLITFGKILTANQAQLGSGTDYND